MHFSVCIKILTLPFLFLVFACSPQPAEAPAFEKLKVLFMFSLGSHIENAVISPDSFFFGELSLIQGSESQTQAGLLAPEKLPNLNSEKLNQWVTNSQTQVLLIQHQGKIIHESYSPDSNQGLNINGFSMAKTLTALLIGIAIDEGLIQSELDMVKFYLPELNIADNDSITLRDLLQQRSGMSDPGSAILITLKGKDLENKLTTLEFAKERSQQGLKEFKYSNVNYHLLTLILQRIYQQPYHEILAQKLWLPMQLENAQVITSTGYCCVFATARSWLKIGELFLNDGRYIENEQTVKQIVSKTWLDKMRHDDSKPENFIVQLTARSYNNFYSYHIFSGLDNYSKLYWSEGMGLELFIVSPDTQTVIVRLGDMASPFKPGTTYSSKILMEALDEHGLIQKDKAIVTTRPSVQQSF